MARRGGTPSSATDPPGASADSARRGDVWRAALPQVARGFAMGAADIVPGVSGGTVALVFGIYERLVHNIRLGASALGRVVKADRRGATAKLREVRWSWLLPLLGGIGLAVLTLAKLIRFLLDEYPVETSAVFFGLIAASIVVAWRIMRRPGPVHAVVIAAVTVGFFVVLGLSRDTVGDPAWWFVVASGALAICAMILPGISGSFILLMLGMYTYVLDAVDQRDLGVILLFGIGAVLGLALFSELLDWLLTHYHDVVVAVLIGLMLGSLRVLWPWPPDESGGKASAALEVPPAGEWVVPAILALVAAAIVVVVAELAQRREAVPATAKAG